MSSAGLGRRPPIFVTGATGRIGRLVVDELVRGGETVRALTRRPDATSFSAGVEIVAGDFTVPSSLDAALDGVATVFLVWTAALATAADVVTRLAARSRRVVYLSAPFRTPHPFFQQPNPMRELHAEIERLLAESGLDVAVLRSGMFASNALHWWAPQIRVGDVVRWAYADAASAPVAERDIAAVAARVLTDARHSRGDYVLTGSESLTHVEQIHEIGEAIGRALEFEQLSPDEFRRQIAASWPAAVTEMLLGAWRASVGLPAFVTTAVSDILGRPPTTFRQWAVDHAAAFERGRAR